VVDISAAGLMVTWLDRAAASDLGLL